MTKQGVKITILFILMIALSAGGWHLYKRIEHNKNVSNVNIYHHIPSLASEVIIINNKYKTDNIIFIDSQTSTLIQMLDKHLSYPLIVCKYDSKGDVIISKSNYEQEKNLTNFFENGSEHVFPIKKRIYKDSELLIYNAAKDQFFAYSFIKGIFAISKNYRLVENIIDTDSLNSFFSYLNNYERTTENLKNNAPIGLFFKMKDYTLAFNYKNYTDSITMEGYLIENKEGKTKMNPITDSLFTPPYLIVLPDSFCIRNAKIEKNNKETNINITLGKRN